MKMMTISEHEENARIIAALRSAYSHMKHGVESAERALADWEDENLAELHSREDMNKLYEDAEK